MGSCLSTSRELESQNAELRKVNAHLYESIKQANDTALDLDLDLVKEKAHHRYLEELSKVDQKVLDRLEALQRAVNAGKSAPVNDVEAEFKELSSQLRSAQLHLQEAQEKRKEIGKAREINEGELAWYKEYRQQLDEAVQNAKREIAECTTKVDLLLEFYDCWNQLGDLGVTRILMEEIRREFLSCMKQSEPSDPVWSSQPEDIRWFAWRQLVENPHHTNAFSSRGLSTNALDMMKLAVDHCSPALHGEDQQFQPRLRLGNKERVLEAACRVFEECEEFQALQALQDPNTPLTPVDWDGVLDIFNFYDEQKEVWTMDKIKEVRAKIAAEKNLR